MRRLSAWLPGRLGWALLVSLLTHLGLLFGGEINLRPVPDLQRLEAKLVRAAPAAKVGDAPKQEKPPKPPAPKKKPPPVPVAAVAEAKDPPLEAKPKEAPQPEPQPEIASAPQEEVPPSPPEPPAAVGSNWPKQGRITYMVLMGDQRIGRQTSEKSKAVLYWQISPEGKYELSVDMTIADIPYMPFFKLNLAWFSAGRVDEGGLQPTIFKQEMAFSDVAATFDWQAMVVNVNGKSLPLLEGTQDLASILLQIGYPGVVEKGSMPIATERRVEPYPIQRVGEVPLPLPFGVTWRTQHLYIPSERSKLRRVWIAPDYFGLPVQIELAWKGVKYYLVAKSVEVDPESAARASAPRNPAPVAAPASTALPTPAPAAVPASTVPATVPASTAASGELSAAAANNNTAEGVPSEGQKNALDQPPQ